MKEVRRYAENKEIINNIECYLNLIGYKLENLKITEEKQLIYINKLYCYRYYGNSKVLYIEFYVHINFIELKSKICSVGVTVKEDRERFESGYFQDIKEIEDWIVKFLQKE